MRQQLSLSRYDCDFIVLTKEQSLDGIKTTTLSTEKYFSLCKKNIYIK